MTLVADYSEHDGAVGHEGKYTSVQYLAGRLYHVDYYKHRMRRAIDGAGLPKDCVMHGLRHTAATILMENGCDWQTIAAVTGQRTVEMVWRYTARLRDCGGPPGRLKTFKPMVKRDRFFRKRDTAALVTISWSAACSGRAIAARPGSYSLCATGNGIMFKLARAHRMDIGFTDEGGGRLHFDQPPDPALAVA